MIPTKTQNERHKFQSLLITEEASKPQLTKKKDWMKNNLNKEVIKELSKTNYLFQTAFNTRTCS
jgi:type II restriction/modification system DNA methylase subunit YeeA